MSAAMVLTGDFGTVGVSDAMSVVPDLERARAPRIRLTRRGRVVFGGLATVLVAGLLALLAAVAAPSAVASNVGSGEEFRYVVAAPGTSLWSLASELDPESDPRDLVAEIVQLNQLSGSSVQAGQAVAVPLRYSDEAGTISAEEAGL